MRLRAVNALLTTIVVAGLLGSAVAASPVSADQSESDSVPYYRDAVAWAQGAGVVTGCVPLGVAMSRGEVIVVIHKALGEPEAGSVIPSSTSGLESCRYPWRGLPTTESPKEPRRRRSAPTRSRPEPKWPHSSGAHRDDLAQDQVRSSTSSKTGKSLRSAG